MQVVNTVNTATNAAMQLVQLLQSLLLDNAMCNAVVLHHYIHTHRLRAAHLHGEVKGHELHDRSQALVGSARGNACEAHLGDGRVHDAPGSVLLEQPLGHLVRALVLRHLLA